MAQQSAQQLIGGCTCGSFSFKTHKVPATRFVCHCLLCQAFTGKAFSDVCVMLSHQITLNGTENLTHKKYRLPPNIDRARCDKCGDPAMETMGFRPLQLVFIPSPNFANAQRLPPPSMHIFYNRRVADAVDSLPKYEYYWPSELAVIKKVMGF
jgi:hypothetical protein